MGFRKFMVIGEGCISLEIFSKTFCRFVIIEILIHTYFKYFWDITVTQTSVLEVWEGPVDENAERDERLQDTIKGQLYKLLDFKEQTCDQRDQKLWHIQSLNGSPCYPNSLHHHLFVLPVLLQLYHFPI